MPLGISVNIVITAPAKTTTKTTIILAGTLKM